MTIPAFHQDPQVIWHTEPVRLRPSALLRAPIIAALCVGFAALFHAVGGGPVPDAGLLVLLSGALTLGNLLLVRRHALWRTLLASGAGQLPLHAAFAAGHRVPSLGAGHAHAVGEPVQLAVRTATEHPPMWLAHIGAAVVTTAVVGLVDGLGRCARRLGGQLIRRVLLLWLLWALGRVPLIPRLLAHRPLSRPRCGLTHCADPVRGPPARPRFS